MAQLRMIHGVPVKVRNPWAVWALTLVTLGVYGVVYWYLVNRELRDYSAAAGAPLGNDPVASVLALVPGGWLILPPFFSYAGTAKRTRRCLGLATGTVADGPSVLVTILLAVVLQLHLVYLQAHLNRILESSGAATLTNPTLDIF